MKADDPSASLLQHHSGHMTDAVEGSFQIDVNNSGKSSSLIFMRSPSFVTPALFTRISTRPYFSATALKKLHMHQNLPHCTAGYLPAPAVSISAFVSRAFSSEPL